MMENLETRNPVLLPSGAIDCEINHPVFGWVPFTATTFDIQPYGPIIHARLLQEIEGE